MMTKNIPNRLALIVLISACSIILISMGLRQTFGLFFKAFEEGLGVTRTEFGLAIGMQKALSKEERIKIAKGLSVIAAADKEIAEGEQAFFNGCLKCLGLTFEDLK